MHPALSVIFFTTVAGAGYGLLALLGVFGAAGLLPPQPWLGAASFALALALVTAGLLASTLHLGHPERAWRAFGQWRSSWLSREGVAAVATYVPALAYAAGWVLLGRNDGIWALLGLLTAAGAGICVYCTAMIYASLRPIPTWSNAWTAPNYLALALASGALWLCFLAAAFGALHWLLPAFAMLAVLVAALLKLGYWANVDSAPARSTAESATGLGRFGKVRLFEAPHTQPNYLLREMGFRIARKHAGRLRALSFACAFALPLLLLLATLAVETQPALALLLLLAALLGTLGAFIERWLFFAEARHTVTLYYGDRAA